MRYRDGREEILSDRWDDVWRPGLPLNAQGSEPVRMILLTGRATAHGDVRHLRIARGFVQLFIGCQRWASGDIQIPVE
ncbi:MAG: hypothetical protein HYV01_15800 [Deltaproteobacteria bacterium]|nr:hypothetical protein [Deltaproteobacteria bacterium]